MLFRRSDSMSRAMPSNNTPAGVRKASIARVRRTSRAGWTNPGRYQATTRMPRALSASTNRPSACGLTTSVVLRSFAVST